MKSKIALPQFLSAGKKIIFSSYLSLLLTSSILAVDFINPNQQAVKCISINLNLIQAYDDDLTSATQTGNLPPGLTFTFNNGANTAVLSGIPTQIGEYIFNIEVLDGIEPFSQSFTFNIVNIDAGGPGETCQESNYSITGIAYTGVTFNWSGGAGSFNNNTLVNPVYQPGTGETGIITLTLQVINGTCTATDDHILTIKPKPELLSSLTPPDICSSTPFSYSPTSATAGTSFNWDRAAVTGITPAGPTSGTGDPDETLQNTTTSPIDVTYQYFLSANGCNNTQDVVVTVNPIPVLSSTLTPPGICSSTAFNYTPASATTGTSFNWSRVAVTGITPAGPTSGTGDPGETLVNTTSAAINVTYQYTLTANSCNNNQDVVLTVKPVPSTPGDQTISQAHTGLDVTLHVDGTNIKWYDSFTSTPPFHTGNDYTLAAPAADTYTFYVSQTINNCESVRSTITLNITRPAVDVVLVLDKSGSMKSYAPGTSKTKWTILNEAVTMFLEKYVAFNVEGDQVGTVLFNETLDVLDDGAGNTMMDIDPTASGIITSVISNPIADGYTAMGGGLQMGINMLNPDNNTRPKNIILFTDGMQNRNLWVDESSLAIVSNPGKTTAPGMILEDGRVLDSNLGIKVFSIGVGATAPFQGLLNNIGSGTAADFRVTSDPATDLDLFFTESFVNALSIGSPQLVDYRYGTLPENGKTENFMINNDATQLFVKLLFEGETNLDMEVMKGDISFNEKPELIKSGTFYKIFSINFPYILENQEIQPGGEWKFNISGLPGTQYKIAALVNDHKLDYKGTVEQEYLMAGDRMNLQLELKYKDTPVENARKISAYVLQPGEDIGELLSRTSVIDMVKKRSIILEQDKAYIDSLVATDTLLTDYNSTAEIKLKLLLDHPEILEKLQPKEKKVKMKHSGNGIYTGKTKRCKTQGSYRILFRIEGSDEEIGDYYRLEDKSVLVHIADPSLFRSQVRLIPADPVNNKPARLYLRPKDKYGNYMGPGRQEQIKVVVSNGSANIIQEQMDGSYIIPLDQVPDISTAEIEIFLNDQSLFRIDLGKIKTGLPWWMSSVMKLILDKV